MKATASWTIYEITMWANLFLLAWDSSGWDVWPLVFVNFACGVLGSLGGLLDDGKRTKGVAYILQVVMYGGALALVCGLVVSHYWPENAKVMLAASIAAGLLSGKFRPSVLAELTQGALKLFIKAAADRIKDDRKE